MAIRHLKHRYLIKKQFLEEKWLITSDFFLFQEFQISHLFDGDFSCLDSFKYPKCMMERSWKIIILFSFSFFHSFFFFLFRLGTLIVGDANLMAMWTVLTGFFWSKVICVVPVNGKGFSQIWIILELLAQSVSGCPSQKVWVRLNCLGEMESLAFG